MKLIIHGAPRTKKNHGYVAVVQGRDGRKRRFHMPSKAWQKWEKKAEITEWDHGRIWTICTPVNCRAIFYRDADRGDAVGYYQGLADLLEKRGIVANDKFLRAWDGSRLRLDLENPRVEVELTPIKEQEP